MPLITSALAFPVVMALAILVGIGLLMFRIGAVKREAEDIYQLRAEDGQIHAGVSEAQFKAAWQRAHYPRATAYGLAALVILAILVPIGFWIFEFVWRQAWLVSGRVEALDHGTLIHTFAGVVFAMALTIVTAIPLIRRYQLHRPRRFERELERETQAV